MEKTVTTQQCIELSTSQAVNSLRFSKAQTTIRVAQIMQAARQVHDAYETSRRALLEEHGTSDPETGQLATNPDGTLKFKSAGGRKKFEAEHRELLAATTTVVVPKVADDELEAEGATPGAIFPLLPFVEVRLE